mgnify:CR=1 FL=1
MPVRSLRSSVLRWPDGRTVDRAVRSWARKVAQGRPDVLRIGYFGSYARGDWGVGSDLDLVVVVKSSDLPFERRGLDFDTSSLPVPADLLVYTEVEWKGLEGQPGFGLRLARETVWVWDRCQPPSPKSPKSAK